MVTGQTLPIWPNFGWLELGQSLAEECPAVFGTNMMIQTVFPFFGYIWMVGRVDF
jgi:hypothetical protein